MTEDLLPKTKDDVVAMVKRTNQNNNKHRVPDNELLRFKGSAYGNGPTNYKKWLSIGEKRIGTKAFYPIDYQDLFEPYIMGYKRGMPRYWSDFRGYGYNRFSWCMEIHKAGYDFAVLKDFYMVHMNHLPPAQIAGTSSTSSTAQNDLQDTNRRHWKNFKEYLSMRYPDTIATDKKTAKCNATPCWS